MRGEKDIVAVLHGEAVGSPPHARGKGKAQYSKAAVFGITPACAGKSG